MSASLAAVAQAASRLGPHTAGERSVAPVGPDVLPVLVMTYWNAVKRHDVRAFARDLAPRARA
jgi:hypothetical protein